MKRNWAVATRFDTLAVRYPVVVQVGAINAWLHSTPYDADLIGCPPGERAVRWGVRGYGVVSENGDNIEGASEDALFEMISALDDTDNTFIVIEPHTDDSAWFASVAVLEEGGYEIARRDFAHHEHKVHTETDISRIALDLIVWLAARNAPGQPARRGTDF